LYDHLVVIGQIECLHAIRGSDPYDDIDYAWKLSHEAARDDDRVETFADSDASYAFAAMRILDNRINFGSAWETEYERDEETRT
jgi:hypothetical protein